MTITATPQPLGGTVRDDLPQQLSLQIRAYDSARRLLGTSAPVAYGAAASLDVVLPAGSDLIAVSNGNGSAPTDQPLTVTLTSHGAATPGTAGPANWVEDVWPYTNTPAAPDVHYSMLTFDRPIDAATLTSDTVVLRNGGSGAVVPATLSYDAPTRTLTVTPDSALQAETAFELTVDAGSPAQPAADTGGAPMPFQWTSFVTPGPPPAVRDLAVSGEKTVSLSWRMPDFSDFRNTAVYVTPGTVPLTSPGGTLLYYGSLTSFTDAGIVLGQDYAFSVFTYSINGGLSAVTSAVVRGSTTTLTSTPVAPTFGQSVTVVTTVRGADGQPMPGRAVNVFSRRIGRTAWSTLGTVVTDAAGQASVTVTPSQDTQFDSVVHGDASHTASTNVLTVPLRFSVTSVAAPPTAAVGSTVRFTGAVAPARPGAPVWLEGLWNNTWHVLGTSTLTASSGYAFTVVPTRVSTYVYRVYKPADTILAAGATPSFSVVTH